MKLPRLSRLNLLIHIGALVPLALLIWDYANGNLTVNWIQGAEQRTGKIAIALLMLSLACTPMITLTGWRKAQHLRRPLGVYAFFYAALHFTIFSIIDYGLDLALLKDAIFEKPYALVGFSAFLMLIPLAATSWKWWMRRLGKGWTRLHRLVYLAGVLVVIHYAWVIKGDVLALRGAIAQPLMYIAVLIALLALRLPPVRKWVVNIRVRSRRSGERPRPAPGRPEETPGAVKPD